MPEKELPTATRAEARLGKLLLWALTGGVLGGFVWEVLNFQGVCVALLGPGFHKWLPKPSIVTCAAAGWAVVAALWALGERRGAGLWPCAPLVLLAGIALPGSDMLAPYLVIMAVSWGALLAVAVPKDPAAGAELDRPKSGGSLKWAAAMAGAYFVVFGAMGLLQYAALNVSETDTTSFERMLWFTLRGRVLYTGEASFFADHVQLVLLALVPLYWLWPSLNMLMLLQTLALAAGGLAVWALAKRRLSPRLALVCTAAYLLYPPMQFLNLEATYNTFRPISFSVPLLLWAMVFVDRGRMWRCALCAVGALCCKEEYGLIVFTLGVFVMLKHRRWRWGAGLAALGGVWFALSIWVVIPHVRGGALRFMPHYTHIGRSPGDVARHLVLHPVSTLAATALGEQTRFVLALLCPLALLPVLGWEWVLIASPTLAYALLSNRPAQRSIIFHYHAPVVPFAVCGAVVGAERLTRWLRRWRPAAQANRAVAVLLLTAAGAGSLLMAKSPVSLAFWNRRSANSYRLYLVGERTGIVQEIQKQMPATASVEASLFMSPHFPRREVLLRYPEPDAHADYVIVDLRERWLDPAAALTDLTRRVAQGGYEQVVWREGIVVLRRVAEGP